MSEKILSFDLINYQNIHINVGVLLKLVLVLIITKLVIVFIKKMFKISGKKRSLRPEEWISFFIIIKYFIWLTGITLMLHIIGVNVTMLIAGSSALLIGLGLGMQHYLYDIFAGLIILFEKKVTVGTLIEFTDGEMIKITDVKMRFLEGVGRDGVLKIIPNSKVLSKQINCWEHDKIKTRFSLELRAAYGCDPEKTEQLMLQAVAKHKECCQEPAPFVRLYNFGESALQFQLFFWSKDKFRINQIKSDLNKLILQLFMENGIKIPYPQQDIHIIEKV